MGRLRQQESPEMQPFTQLQTEGPTRQTPPIQPPPQLQQGPQQDAQQAQALSQNLDRVGQSVSRQADRLDSSLPLTQRAGEEKSRQVEESARQIEAERPAEAAEIKKSGDLAKEELDEAKKARSAGDKAKAETHIEKAREHLDSALEKADAIGRLDLAVRELKDAGAPAEIISTMKMLSVKPSVARELSAYARSATDELKKAPAEDKAAMGSIYSRGLLSLKAGKKVEADLHSSLAKAYPRASAGDKKKIDDASSSSAKGRMSAAEVMALMSALRTGPSGAGIPPGKIRERLLALQKKIIELSGMPGRSSDVSKISALVSPATRYIARAEEARKVGDDAKAAEFEELAIRHLSEAEAMIKRLEAPSPVVTGPARAVEAPLAPGKTSEPYSDIIKKSMASIKDPDVLALLTTTLVSLVSPTDQDLKKANALAGLADAYAAAETTPDGSEIKSVIESVFDGRTEPENALEYVEIFMAAKPKAATSPPPSEEAPKVATEAPKTPAKPFSKLAAAAAKQAAKPPSPPAPKEVFPEEEKPLEVGEKIPADLMEFAKAEFAGTESQLSDLLKMGGERPEDLLKALGGVYSEKLGKMLHKLKDEDLAPAMNHLTSMANPTLEDLKSAKEFHVRISASEAPKPVAAPAESETIKPETPKIPPAARKGPTVIDYGFAPAAAKPTAPAVSVAVPAETAATEKKPLAPEGKLTAEKSLADFLSTELTSADPERRAKILGWMEGLSKGTLKAEDVVAYLKGSYLSAIDAAGPKLPEPLSRLLAGAAAALKREGSGPEDLKLARNAISLTLLYVHEPDPERKTEMEGVASALSSGALKPELGAAYVFASYARAEISAIKKSDKSKDKSGYDLVSARIGTLLTGLAGGEAHADASALIAAYLRVARAYREAGTKAERAHALALINSLSSGELAPERASAISDLSLRRDDAESSIVRSKAISKKDKNAVLVNIRAYYDAAIVLYERGDAAGAERVLAAAGLYLRALEHGGKTSPVVDFVYGLLGDYSKVPAMAASKEPLRLLSSSFLAKAKVSPSPPDAPLFAAVSGRSSLDEALGAKGLTAEGLKLEFLSHDIALRKTEAAALAGGTDIKGAPKEYSKKAAYFEKRAKEEDAKGHTAEAKRLRDAAALSDHDKMKGRVKDGLSRLDRSYAGIRSAIDMRKKSAGLRAAASSEKDSEKKAKLEDEARRIDADAAKLAAAAFAGFEAARGELGALAMINHSITAVNTPERDRGLVELDEAAELYADAGGKILSSGRISDSEIETIKAAEASATVGAGKVHEQLLIEKAARMRWAKISALEKRGKGSVKRYSGLKIPLRPDAEPEIKTPFKGKAIVDKLKAKIPITTESSELAYTDELEKKWLTAAKAAAAKGDFVAADKAIALAALAAGITETKAAISLEHYGLLKGASDSERFCSRSDRSKCTGMKEYKAHMLLDKLDTARAALEAGDIAGSTKALREADRERRLGLANQTFENMANAEEKIAADARGRADYARALMKEFPDIKDLASKIIARGESEASGAEARAKMLREAKISGVGDLITPAIAEKLASATGFPPSGVLEKLMEDPGKMKEAAAALRKKGLISEKAEAGLVAMSEHRSSSERYMRAEKGLSLSLSSIMMAKKASATSAAISKVEGVTSLHKEGLRESEKIFLDLSKYAVDHPDTVIDDIKGESKIITAGGKDLTFDGAWSKAALELYGALEKKAADRKAGELKESWKAAELEVRLRFAADAGLCKGSDGRWTEVGLKSETRAFVRDRLKEMDDTLKDFTRLSSFDVLIPDERLKPGALSSLDERVTALYMLGQKVDKISADTLPVLGEAADRGKDTSDAKALAKSGEFATKFAKSYSDSVDSLISEGKKEEKYWGYTVMGVKAGLHIALGFGAGWIIEAALGAGEEFISMADAARIYGGWDNVPESVKNMAIAGMVFAVLDVTGSGMGAAAGVYGEFAEASARMAFFKAAGSVAEGVSTAGDLSLAGIGLYELEKSGEAEWIDRIFIIGTSTMPHIFEYASGAAHKGDAPKASRPEASSLDYARAFPPRPETPGLPEAAPKSYGAAPTVTPTPAPTWLPDTVSSARVTTFDSKGSPVEVPLRDAPKAEIIRKIDLPETGSAGDLPAGWKSDPGEYRSAESHYLGEIEFGGEKKTVSLIVMRGPGAGEGWDSVLSRAKVKMDELSGLGAEGPKVYGFVKAGDGMAIAVDFSGPKAASPELAPRPLKGSGVAEGTKPPEIPPSAPPGGAPPPSGGGPGKFDTDKAIKSYPKEPSVLVDVKKMAEGSKYPGGEKAREPSGGETPKGLIDFEADKIREIMSKPPEKLSPDESSMAADIRKLTAGGMIEADAVKHYSESRFSGEVNLDETVPFAGPDGKWASAPLRDAPSPTLGKLIAMSASASVYESVISVGGETKKVVVKVFTEPGKNFGYAKKELDGLRTAASIKTKLPDGREVPLGPEPYGFALVNGKYAIVMEHVEGSDLSHLSASEISKCVTPETYGRLGAMWNALTSAGYDIGDFQFFVVTKDGSGRKAGDVVFVDLGALKPRTADAETADSRVKSAKNITVLRMLEAEFDPAKRAGKEGYDDYAPVLSDEEKKVLSYVARGGSGERIDWDPVLKLLRVPPDARPKMVEGTLKIMRTGGEVAGEAKTRAVLRGVEEKTGMVLLAPRPADLSGSAGTLNLSDPSEGPKNLAMFARKMVLKDPEAMPMLDTLAPGARRALDALCADTGFETFAKHMTDEEFEKNWGRVRSRRNAIEKALSEILTAK